MRTLAILTRSSVLLDLGLVLGPEGVEDAWLIYAPISVSAEEVTLPLDQGGGEPIGTQPVVVGQRAGEDGDGDAGLGGTGHNTPPRVLGLLDSLLEEGVEE